MATLWPFCGSCGFGPFECSSRGTAAKSKRLERSLLTSEEPEFFIPRMHGSESARGQRDQEEGAHVRRLEQERFDGGPSCDGRLWRCHARRPKSPVPQVREAYWSHLLPSSCYTVGLQL